MQNKLTSLLGLSRRAGKLTMGHDPVAESVAKGESCLVLMAQDLSPRTKKSIVSIVGTAVPLVETALTLHEMGFAVGKRVGVVSVNEAGFAKKLQALAEAHANA